MVGIVLLESDDLVREHLSKVLANEGFDVTAIGSLSDAKGLKKKNGKAGLLIANLLLDDGPGMDFVGKWTSRGGAVLGLTDIYYSPTVRHFMRDQQGLLDLLSYPVESDELIDRLRTHYGADYPANTMPAMAISGEEPRVSLPEHLDMRRCQLTGDCRDVSMAVVFARLAAEKVNGALMLQDERVKKLVYFEDGVPVGVKSNVLAECLGQMLVEEHHLTQEQCDESVAEMRRKRRQQGEVLIGMTLLTEESLDQAMRRQFIRKFTQVFSWESGEYRYRDAPIPAAFARRPDDPAQLLWSGILDCMTYDRIRRQMGSVWDFPAAWTGEGLDLSRMEVPLELRPLLELVDGRRSPEDIVAQMPDDDGATRLLYALTILGTVTYLTAG